MYDLKRVLDTGANIVVMLVGIAVLGSLVEQYTGHISNQSRKPERGLEIGAPLPPLPHVPYRSHRATLVIFANTLCISCRQGIQDYEDLKRLIEDSGSVFVCGVFKSEDDEAIARMGWQLPAIRVNDFSRYNVSGTPTVVLVDRAGKIREFWVGRLTANVKQRLVRLIKEI